MIVLFKCLRTREVKGVRRVWPAALYIALESFHEGMVTFSLEILDVENDKKKSGQSLTFCRRKLLSTSNINRGEAKLWLGCAHKKAKTVITSIFYYIYTHSQVTTQLDAPTRQTHFPLICFSFTHRRKSIKKFPIVSTVYK